MFDKISNNKKYSIITLLIIILTITSNLTYSANDSNTSLTENNIIGKNPNIKDTINLAKVDLTHFFKDVESSEIIIITGSKVSAEDKLMFKLIKSELSETSSITFITDKEAIKRDDLNSKTLVLLGSERTNYISNQIITQNKLVSSQQKEYNPLIAKYGFTDNNKKIILLYSQKEIENNENMAVKNSPLNKLMDEKYVPAVATLISIILLTLWNIFGSTIIDLVSDYVSKEVKDNRLKKKIISEIKRNHHQKTLRVHELMHRGEIMALVISIIVFSLMIAWTWTNENGNFWNMLITSIIIVTLISIMKEIIRQNFCYKKKVGVEYIFWPFGTIVTVLSTYFGNTFSMASRELVEEKDEDKTFGKIAFLTSIFTFIIALLAYIANILYPSILLQLVYIYAILTTFIDMFPMNPMDGASMRKWNFSLWLIFYIVVFVCYLFMSFTSYI